MARKKSKEEIDNNLLLANVRELMKTRQGKEFMWYILELCDVYGDYSSSDVHTMVRAEVRRSVETDVIFMMTEADPTMYPRLLLDKQQDPEDKDE